MSSSARQEPSCPGMIERLAFIMGYLSAP
jgi:hypothetical protein